MNVKKTQLEFELSLLISHSELLYIMQHVHTYIYIERDSLFIYLRPFFSENLNINSPISFWLSQASIKDYFVLPEITKIVEHKE